jgi:hypothetical protein
MRVLVQGDTNAMGQGADGLGRGAGRRRASWGSSRVTLRENTEEAGDQVDAGAKCAGWNRIRAHHGRCQKDAWCGRMMEESSRRRDCQARWLLRQGFVRNIKIQVAITV